MSDVGSEIYDPEVDVSLDQEEEPNQDEAVADVEDAVEAGTEEPEEDAEEGEEPEEDADDADDQDDGASTANVKPKKGKATALAKAKAREAAFAKEDKAVAEARKAQLADLIQRTAAKPRPEPQHKQLRQFVTRLETFNRSVCESDMETAEIYMKEIPGMQLDPLQIEFITQATETMQEIHAVLKHSSPIELAVLMYYKVARQLTEMFDTAIKMAVSADQKTQFKTKPVSEIRRNKLITILFMLQDDLGELERCRAEVIRLLASSRPTSRVQRGRRAARQVTRDESSALANHAGLAMAIQAKTEDGISPESIAF